MLWTGPFKTLAVGPSAEAPDGRPSAAELLYLDLPSDLPGKDSKGRVSVARCKPCANPHDTEDMPRFLPAGLTQYVLNNYTTKSPPYHVKRKTMFPHPPVERLDVEQITGHQSVRGRVVSSLSLARPTGKKGLLRPSWEREMDLQHFRRRHVLRYWSGTPNQHRQTNRRYRAMRIVGAALRELARAKGERHISSSYSLVSLSIWDLRFSAKPIPIGAFFWYKTQDELWWLGKIYLRTANSTGLLHRALPRRSRSNQSCSLFPPFVTRPILVPCVDHGVYKYTAVL